MPSLSTADSAGQALLDLADGLSGAVLGLLFYGAWAVWANAEHGSALALRAGALQGSLSFAVTLGGTSLMKTLFRGPGAAAWRALRAMLGTLALIYGLIIAVHLWHGTPEIALTLAPGLPITIAFCASYCLGLARYRQPPAPQSA